MPRHTVVRASGLAKSFPRAGGGTIPVLSDISLDIAAGEFVAVVGPSGSGKSTLLTCLSGLEPVSAGRVEIAGTDITTLRPGALAALRREHVGFVFQSYNLLPALSARENVALPARLGRRRVSRQEVDGALAAVGLSDRADHLPALLSGGQQQRVAIARVLACRPEVLFADEPTGALDSASSETVLQLLRATADEGRAVVMVTHDLEAAAMSDRVVVLRDGVVHDVIHGPTVETVYRAVRGSRTTAAAS